MDSWISLLLGYYNSLNECFRFLDKLQKNRKVIQSYFKKSPAWKRTSKIDQFVFMKIAIFCPNVYTCTHLPRGPLCNNSQFISKTVVTQSCQMTRLVTVIRPSHTSKTRVFRAHCHWTSNLQIQPPTETRTENYQPMLKKSLFFALGFCFVLLEAEVNVFLCDLSLHRRLMKVNFVLGFGIAITNSRGFNRWKVCFISFFPRQQPNSDKEMINVGCG